MCLLRHFLASTVTKQPYSAYLVVTSKPYSLGVDLVPLLLPSLRCPPPVYPMLSSPSAAQLLDTTRYAQPALFAVECATASALMSSGVTPSAVMGHSLGELAAACIAGVMGIAEVI